MWIPKIFIFFVLCLSFIYCNDPSSVNTETDTITNDSIITKLPIIEEDTAGSKLTYTKPPRGIYRVLLSPLELTINFHFDQSYLLEEKNGNKITRTSGSWKPTNGIIWTYKDHLVQGRYKWQGDTLAYIETKTQKTYPMQKLSGILDNNVWRNKGKQGFEFFGLGNEPFWSIEVDEQKAISFQLADWNNPLIFKPVSPIITSDSIVYNLSSDLAAIKITVFNQFCSDGMSDYIYDNKVEVIFNNQTYTGCGILYK